MEIRKLISSSTHRSRWRSFCVVVLQRTADEMYKGLLNTVVQPLFCTLNLLFGDADWRRGLLQTQSTLRRRNLKTHTALFLQLGLRSRIIHHENGAFRKRSSHQRNLKTPALNFRTENILKRTFSSTIGSGEQGDFPGRDFLKQRYKTTGDCCVLKLLRCSVDDRA